MGNLPEAPKESRINKILFDSLTPEEQDTIIETAIAVMKNEQTLFPKNMWRIPELYTNTNIRNNFKRIYNVAFRVIHNAYFSKLHRSYNHSYGVSKEENAAESIGGHTELVEAIVDCMLELIFQDQINGTIYDYTYRDILEAVRRHDLPEIIIGDIPDNGTKKHEEVAKTEIDYWENYSQHSISCCNPSHEQKVMALLLDMEDKITPLGRILYLSDKIAAIVATIVRAEDKNAPKIKKDNPAVSTRDMKEMSYCDNCENGFFRASEMWTVDYLEIRKMAQYDDTGYFTSVLVMITIILNGKWYDWRERQYKKSGNPF